MTEKEAWQIVLDAAVEQWACDTRNMQLRDAIELIDHRAYEERERKATIANFIKAVAALPTKGSRA